MADKPKEPPVTVPIPGARPLSPEEQAALGKRPAGDKPPKRPSIQYSAPPSRSAGSFGVPRPGPPVAPIPTPLDITSGAPPKPDLDAETVLSNTELSRYGYRRLADHPPDAGQSERSSERATVVDERDVRKAYQHIIGNRPASDGSALEKAAVSSEGKPPDLPGTKTLDYLGLGLLLATPAVVVDMYVRGSNIDWHKVAIAAVASCTAGGFCVWASHWWQAWRTANNRLLPYLATFESKFWGKAIIVAAAIGFALILRSFLSTEPPPVQAGFTQQQVDEKIATATRPLEAQIATLKAQQLPDVQKPPLQIGPQEALIISKYLGNSNVLLKDSHWAIFFTYPRENQKFYDTLLALIRDRLDPWILNAPDNSIDLDAPKFPSPPAEPGITFHGDNALNRALSQILSQCFIIRRTDKEIDGLSEWFNKRLSDPERAENRKITWIEIGRGSPWLQGNRLSTNCLQ